MSSAHFQNEKCISQQKQFYVLIHFKMLQAKLKAKQRLPEERMLCSPYSNFLQFNCNEKTFLCFVKTSKCVSVFHYFQLR